MGMINKNKWGYQGTKEDKYLWALKKDAQKKGQTRKDGWPSYDYLTKWLEYADRQLDGGFDNAYVFDGEYTIEKLYEGVDDFLYRCSLEFGPDVLGRASDKKLRSWFK
jgi:hypothetical protein